MALDYGKNRTLPPFRRKSVVHSMAMPVEQRAVKAQQKLADSAETLVDSAETQEDSAARRTRLAANRTLLAAERTYAAWMRTGLAGLASGIVNTAFMMGGALGLAVLASLAASRSDSLASSGDGPLLALNGCYHAAFLVGALFAVAAALVGGTLLREPAEASAGAHTPATAYAE